MSGVKTLDDELVQELNSLRASCSCANPLLLIGIAALLVIIPGLQLLLSFRKSRASARQLVTLRFNSPLQFAGVVFNGCLGLVYLGLGLWMVAVDSIHQDGSAYLPHWWLVALLQGFSLILTGFVFGVRPCFLGVAFVRFWSVFLTVCAAFISYSSMVHIDFADKAITMKACFDVLFLLGTPLLIVYGIGHIKEDGYGETDNDLCEPLNIEISSDTDHSDSQVTPFAKAGFFSTMSFLWLNHLMKMGYEKPLEEKDLPLLDPTDRAHNQYLMLLEKLNSKEELQRNGTPSIFWTIISCHKSEIMVSGLFALVKVLALSSGPLLLKAYVNVSLGKGTFTYEAYVLAAALLFCKCCGSLSQRQWYFRTRRLGLQVQVCGKIAYVSQDAWILSGTVRDNILFVSPMDKQRYQETLSRCCLVKDIEMLPFGDHTQIGERGVTLSGGQKQRIQLARALYQNADIYLLDDPFSAVDAHTATSLFNEYVMGALSDKTVLLVTHQVDFLPVFDSILLMSNGEIIRSAPYQDLMVSCQEFQNLVKAHKSTIRVSDLNKVLSHKAKEISTKEKNDTHGNIYLESVKPSPANQLIKTEEREIGDTGLKPYILYLRQNKGFLNASLCAISYIVLLAGQISQNSWMAANVQNPSVNTLKLILVYIVIGGCMMFFLLSRSLFIVVLGVQTSRSLFSQLLVSLFRAPVSFYDSTPLGRVLSRVSSDLSIVDLDVPFTFMFSVSASLNAYSNLGVLIFVTWQILFIAVPMIVLATKLQRYYLASAKELMRINGTTKSTLANHLGEAISGAATIRAFNEEDNFFAKYLELVDKNAGAHFYNFAAIEWLILRLETMSSVIVSFCAFAMALLPPGTLSPGFVGMALSYALSLNVSFVFSIQNQCGLANQIVAVERVNQFMDIQSEAAEIVEEHRPAQDWPQVGRVELRDLKIRYRQDAPLVLHGITCTFEGGDKIGIVGRTGSGKTTLIGALFRLVEPAEGKILVDSIDITTIGLYDLRSRLGIIPQDPTLFQGTIRYNLDPMGKFSDKEIWEVLHKCQLLASVQEKVQGLDSLVVEDGSNWSMGERQLICLGRILLRRCRILVLDEATASIDNATDAILQKIIRTEFKDCTVITVAHRIPTVMDCSMVLAMSDGKVVEYDKPIKLMEAEGSLFRDLLKEYWSYKSN